MFNKNVILVISSIICFTLFGCSNVAEEKDEPSTKIENTEEKWKQSPLFKSGTYTMIGEEGRLGFIYDDSEIARFYPNREQKYMWHFWGDEQELDGKLTVIATSEDDGEQVALLEAEHLSGPNNSAERHQPSLFSLPKKGMWRLDAYMDEKLFGTIYVEVHKK